MQIKPIAIKPSPLLGSEQAYATFKSAAPIDVFLAGNEGLRPPKALLRGLAIKDPSLLNRYPDQKSLERRIADSLGLDCEQVIVTAGADDAIERAFRAVLAKGRELILPAPTFEMLGRYAALTGCRQIEIPWLCDPFPLEEVLEAVTDKTALVPVVSPNNPTGLVATADDLKAVSAGARNALVLVDLAYAEFADDSLLDAALALPNAIVVRTLSKAWGLAGLRVGFAAGPKQVIEWMRRTGHPYAVSSLSLALAETWLRVGSKSVRKFVFRVKKEREEFYALLVSLGVKALKSQANFVYAEVENAERVRDSLAGLGIAVRTFPGKRYLQNAVRISMPGNRAAFARLCNAMKIALGQEARSSGKPIETEEYIP